MATYLLKTQGKETAKNKLIALNYESNVNAFGLDVGIVGHIMAGYEISRLGKTSAQVQAQFDSIKRQEIVMIWAIYGGIIADALLTDAWVPVYYSSKSALDMLKKNGYLTPAQQQMLYHKWSYGEISGVVNPIKIPNNPSVLGHIFRNANGHYIVDTPANRQAIESTVRQNNFVGIYGNNNFYYARTNPDGTQNWARVRNGVITNGGINTTTLPPDQIIPK